MSQENRSYRIRTQVGSNEPLIHMDMEQTIDTFEILSLKISQSNAYRLMNSDTGLIVGRVVANGGFGVPNAKVSVFVQYEDTDDMKKKLMYYYSSPKDTNTQGIRYNLLPEELDDICHQSVGTFPDKRVLLDNDSWIEIFDKYYKYTTRTNNSGDYMIYGAPIGTQTIHVDVDLSDIGVLSQRPRDMVYKGANINQFESPNKFRVDKNLASLAQIFTEDKTIYVYPFWGDTTDSDTGAAVTRCDINLSYKFEPTCIFMGSIITDTGENSLSKKCVAHKNQGKMSDMITGQGTIEMIRKTPDNKIEQYSVQGNQLIDDDGVWCYQIPMNLDYVITDEFGNTVLTDDPNKGIATRARVRFRIGMTETGTEETARKRARFLVPNNPRLVETDYPYFSKTKEIDYEFGSKTKDENFRDLLWNKVYTVKSYIPRLQKSIQPQNKKYLGIKMVNHSGGNNPMPFNNLSIKFNFTYMFLCALLKVLVTVVRLTNKLICGIGNIFFELFMFCTEFVNNIFYSFKNINDDDWGRGDFVACTYLEWYNEEYGTNLHRPGTTRGLGKWFLKGAFNIGCGIILEGLCEDENGESKSYSPGSGKLVKKLNEELRRSEDRKFDYTPEQTQLINDAFSCSSDVAELYNCIENQLAQENEVTSFNFVNDWVNGVLYMPLWFRKIKPKRRFLFFKLKAKDQWCSSDKRNGQGIFQRNLKLYRTCAQQIQNAVDKDNKLDLYKLQPLVNDSETIDFKNSKANEETGKDEIKFTSISDNNCYGYQCHTQARTYLPIDYGIITEKETIYGEHVYYYRPVDYNTKYNTDLVTLYATDIILLGSLSDCDIHGIPQFFKALSSTTYNMPSDLLVEDFKYEDESNTNSDSYSERMTEITGSDWGNLGFDQSGSGEYSNNKRTTKYSTQIYDNGGLFYGITCFDSYTKPKSCINLSRICEFGISLDESQDILEIGKVEQDNTEDEIYNLYETLIPDGYVSYDEIYDMDYRSIFATLNGNWLKTKVNDNTGLTEYDFNRLYVENFDGLLSNIMQGKVTQGVTEQGGQANYKGNHNLEKNSIDYIKFRFGNYQKKDKNQSVMYFYDYDKTIGGVKNYLVNTLRRFPRYENSFYFYFGLNEGKTAIDKFRTNYFAECTNDSKSEPAYSITVEPNSWCGEENGYIEFETNLPTPISIKLINKDEPEKVYTANNINSENFYVGKENSDSELTYVELYTNDLYISSLPTGEYKLTLIDGEEEEYHDTIIFKDETISYNVNTQAFVYNANELENKYLKYYYNGDIDWKTTFTDIAEDSTINRLSNNRVIGGAIIIENVTVDLFKIYVKPVNSEFFGYMEYVKFINDTNNPADDEIYPIFYDEISGKYVYYVNKNDKIVVGSKNNDDNIEWDNSIINKNPKYEYNSNYPGIDILIGKDNEGNYEIKRQNGVGYVNISLIGNTITIGVPYCDQKYKVKVVEICEKTDEEGNIIYEDSENSLINTVTIYSRVFTMYINGIDYDLIRNFKTGWVEKTVENMSKYRTATDNFTATNIYGWNDLDNIGKIVLKEDGVKSITEYFDGDSLNNYRDNNHDDITKNELKLIGDTLSVNFEGNGKKIYTEKIIRNDDNTSRIERIEYSTPYSWSTSYCYDADEWENDKKSLTDNGSNETIIGKMDIILRNRIEFTKQVKGAFCYDQDGKTLTVTYKSTATPIDYRCVGNQFGLTNDINKTNSGGRPSGNVSGVTTVDYTKMVGDFQIIGDVTTNEVISNMPTLTYNDGEYKNYDKFNNDTQLKLPYYFRIIDNNNNTLPSKGNDNNFQAMVPGNTENEAAKLNVSTMFGVHIYDKPMYFDVKRYWSGFNNYNYNGAHIELPGLLIGDVVNGIGEPVLNIGNNTIDIQLFKNCQDTYTNIDVRRLIYTIVDPDITDPTVHYGTYSRFTTNNTQTTIPDQGGIEGVTGGNNELNTNSDPIYHYIEITKEQNRNIVVSDGYCKDDEIELSSDLWVDYSNTYFTYRQNTESNQYLDYINLNVNNAPSSNIIHYLFEYIIDNNGKSNYIYDELYDNGENDKKSKWEKMPDFFINEISGYKISSTTNRITIPKIDNIVPKELSKQFFILSVCDDKYYTLSPVIDYTPIRCFALHKESENAPINKTIVYLTSNIKNDKDWQSIDTIHYFEKYGFKITKPQYNDVLANQIDFEYRDIYTQNIETPTFVNITVTYKDNNNTSITTNSMKAIKITFDSENEMADWHQIDVIDIIGIRRHCIVDHNSIITETSIQQTSNE